MASLNRALALTEMDCVAVPVTQNLKFNVAGLLEIFLQIDRTVTKGGGSFLWQDNLDEAPPNDDYAAVLIDIPNDDTLKSGQLIRDRGYINKKPVISRYWFGNDGILTINTEYDTKQGQERAWFLNDDFRIRVSSVRMMNGVNLTTYCSERRCVSPQSLDALIQANQARH